MSLCTDSCVVTRALFFGQVRPRSRWSDRGVTGCAVCVSVVLVSQCAHLLASLQTVQRRFAWSRVLWSTTFGKRSSLRTEVNFLLAIAPVALQATTHPCELLLRSCKQPANCAQPYSFQTPGTASSRAQLRSHSNYSSSPHCQSGKQGEDLDLELRTSSRAKNPIVLASQRTQTGQGGGLWLEANRANRARAHRGQGRGGPREGAQFFLSFCILLVCFPLLVTFFWFVSRLFVAFFWGVSRLWWPSPGLFPAFLAVSWGLLVAPRRNPKCHIPPKMTYFPWESFCEPRQSILLDMGPRRQFFFFGTRGASCALQALRGGGGYR